MKSRMPAAAPLRESPPKSPISDPRKHVTITRRSPKLPILRWKLAKTGSAYRGLYGEDMGDILVTDLVDALEKKLHPMEFARALGQSRGRKERDILF